VSDATCETCPFATPWNASAAGVARIICHHAAMAAEFCGDDEPARTETWWCSEHPLRQRDRLAAMAMQGLMAAGWAQDASAGDLADVAYGQADAMLAARSGSKP
jgi:hypothetical protein